MASNLRLKHSSFTPSPTYSTPLLALSSLQFHFRLKTFFILQFFSNHSLLSLFAILWPPDPAQLIVISLLSFISTSIHLCQCLWISLLQSYLSGRLYTGTLNIPTHLIYLVIICLAIIIIIIIIITAVWVTATSSIRVLDVRKNTTKLFIRLCFVY